MPCLLHRIQTAFECAMPSRGHRLVHQQPSFCTKALEHLHLPLPDSRDREASIRQNMITWTPGTPFLVLG